jgi:predicted kinase
VAAGHCAILDAVFATPQERAVAAASAEILGVPFHGLFLEADLDTRLGRLSTRGRDPSDADAAVARLQQSYDVGALEWTRIDASGTRDETLARARKAVNP